MSHVPSSEGPTHNTKIWRIRPPKSPKMLRTDTKVLLVKSEVKVDCYETLSAINFEKKHKNPLKMRVPNATNTKQSKTMSTCQGTCINCIRMPLTAQPSAQPININVYPFEQMVCFILQCNVGLYLWNVCDITRELLWFNITAVTVFVWWGLLFVLM